MKHATRKHSKKCNWDKVLDKLTHRVGQRLRWKQFGSGYVNLGNISNASNISYGSISNTEEAPTQYHEKIIEYNGKRYKYRETDDGNHIFLYRKQGASCFEIFIETVSGITFAHLNTFNNFSDCSIDNDSVGSDMLLAIVDILKPRTDITYLAFSDNSGKEIAPNVWIRLSDVYFVATGKTWYGSVLPLVPDDQEFFNYNYRQITSATWTETLRFMEYHSTIPIKIPVSIKDIDPTAPGSAMLVFRRIKDAKTDFFAKYRNLIMPSVGCNSFFSSTWRYYFDRTTPGTGAAPGH